jgi:hypothetical protein
LICDEDEKGKAAAVSVHEKHNLRRRMGLKEPANLWFLVSGLTAHKE